MATNSWVVDASPIILLGKVGLLEILLHIPDNLCIPEKVAVEISQTEVRDSAAIWMEQVGKAFINKERVISPQVSNKNLGPGEQSVLSFSLSHKGWTAVLDDLAARKCAHSLRIPYTGTLGVILAANHLGLIQDVEPTLSQLIKAGFYISPDIFAKALSLSKK